MSAETRRKPSETRRKPYKITITKRGKDFLSKIRESDPAVRGGPQITGYQNDNKFDCGACGSPLDQHSVGDRKKMWMCTRCGQVYVEACLAMLRQFGTPRTVCTGSNCLAARTKTPLPSVLRKIGEW